MIWHFRVLAAKNGKWCTVSISDAVITKSNTRFTTGTTTWTIDQMVSIAVTVNSAEILERLRRHFTCDFGYAPPPLPLKVNTPWFLDNFVYPIRNSDILFCNASVVSLLVLDARYNFYCCIRTQSWGTAILYSLFAWYYSAFSFLVDKSPGSF